MKHFLVNLYQVYSNGGPEVQNGMRRDGGGGQYLGTLIIFFSRTAGKLVCSIAYWSFNKFVEIVAPGSNMTLRQMALGLNIRNTKKNYSLSSSDPLGSGA